MTAQRTSTEPEATSEELSVLLVGTLGGGGIHRYVEAQAAQLSKREDSDPAVYDMVSDPKGDGVAWFLRSLVASLWALVQFPLQSRPDLVHVHTSHRFSFYRAAPYVLFSRYVWRRPVVLHVHGSSFDQFLATDARTIRRLQDRVFAASDRIVVLSAYWKETLTERVDPAKVAVLPNAVVPEEYDPTYDADPPRVVFVSNHVRRKGIREFVAAVDDLAGRSLPFEVTVAGEGPLADRARELADRHDRVTYEGYVSEQRKRELLSEGSVFVLPAYAEGLPIAMLEGMAGGNAVVATPVGAIPEVIGEDNGRLVAPGDATELRAALAELLNEPEQIRRMGRHNRRLTERRFSWDRVSDQLRELYAELDQ